MATEEDLKHKPDEDVPPPDDGTSAAQPQGGGTMGIDERADDALATVGRGDEAPSDSAEDEDDLQDGSPAPTQLGFKRFVYAAYFAGGIGVAFLLSKFVSFAWLKLALWRPVLGEPRDEMVMPIAAVIGAAVAVYYYRDTKTRTLAEEVASELAKVTWPNREEVVNSTFVVIVTTLVATTFFALMDRFWGFVTNLVYGA